MAITPQRGWMLEPGYAAPAAASTALADRIHASGVITLLVGGALYSAGAVVYAVKWPRLWPSVFGYHEVFHVFVIAATAVYFVFITATVAVPR